MADRPARDRYLDAASAVAAVREQLPALECRHAALLGTGWGVDAYLLDDRFVARFPRTATAAQWINADQAVLTLVSTCLSSAFSVPAVMGRGSAGRYFPYDFLVCAFVPGVTAGDASAQHSEGFAVDLGRALTRIHSVPVAAARNAGLHEVEWDDSGYAGPLRFLHGDFRDGNLVVNPENGRLVGVIDWGNAAVGDPALDFMTLVMWRGWEFMHRVLGAYELPTDDQFLERVSYHAHTQALQALADAVRRRTDLGLPLGWVCNAFSLVRTSLALGAAPNPRSFAD
jgi:aminoglycoside phosphotransferase (APT) family kinase protein